MSFSETEEKAMGFVQFCDHMVAKGEVEGQIVWDSPKVVVGWAALLKLKKKAFKMMILRNMNQNNQSKWRNLDQ